MDGMSQMSQMNKERWTFRIAVLFFTALLMIRAAALPSKWKRNIVLNSQSHKSPAAKPVSID